MRQIENKCMLITYADSMVGDLKSLEHVLDTYFKEEIAGVHILPFFPSSGDRGFAVINYDTVDPSFGTWDDIDRLAETAGVCDLRCQTLTTYGVQEEDIREFLKEVRPAGIDRVVPIGKSMDFSLIWDGYDLIRQMSRRIGGLA